LLLIVVTAACGRMPRPIEVSLEPDETSGGVVRLIGLSSDEISSIDEAAWNQDAWQEFLGVRVATAEPDPPFVLGAYAVNGADVTFTPRFGFDPGRRYIVTVEPSLLPLPRDEPPMTIGVSLPAIERSPTTTVSRVLPSAGVWPENLLRLYIEFSAPMSRTSGLDYVRLVDESGREIVDPFLPLDVDFWNRDYTRYTLFFDPGRVKRDILPNREMGRALEAGRTYALEVEVAWPDAEGQPLAEPFRKTFRAGPPALDPIDPAAWGLTVPAGGTRDALTVSFLRPLDHGLLFRALGVSGPDGTLVEGDIEVGVEEGEWQFTPRSPWGSGAHDLIVLSILEDPAGNRVGRPFEVDQFDRIDDAVEAERTTVRFEVR
jgi:hypothetical protein